MLTAVELDSPSRKPTLVRDAAQWPTGYRCTASGTFSGAGEALLPGPEAKSALRRYPTSIVPSVKKHLPRVVFVVVVVGVWVVLARVTGDALLHGGAGAFLAALVIAMRNWVREDRSEKRDANRS